MKSPNYIEIHIPVHGFEPDTLSGILFLYGCSGIQELNESEWCAWFPGDWSPERLDEMIKHLKKENPAFGKKSLKINHLPVKDWNAVWKKYFKPIQPVQGIWVRPPWEALPADAAGMEIIIDPQMAFGTGHHETTALMMQAMKQIPLMGSRVLDVGCGSGILAILASKSGAEKITALDIDPNAIENTRLNMRLNKVDNISLILGDIRDLPDEQFQVILANINFDVLLALPGIFRERLLKKGNAIVSGILQDDKPAVTSAYEEAGLVLSDCLNKNEWIAMVWRKV